MLTKSDLDAMRRVVREEVENEVQAVKDDLSHDIIMSRMRLQEDIDGLKNCLKNMQLQVRKLKNEEIDEEEVYDVEQA